jgi:bifunctional non-homologous end joining protein LigD
VSGGYTPDNPLDALIVGYYEGNKLMFASKVLNGFVPRLRREVWRKLKHLQTDACPFDNLPEKKRTQWALTREEIKNRVWLKPELVAQIESTEWTPDGHLRHSSSAVGEMTNRHIALSGSNHCLSDQRMKTLACALWPHCNI